MWNRRDLAAGLMYVALGLIVCAVARTYPMGSASAMGPGYLPFSLGVLLVLAGTVVIWNSRGDAIEAVGWWDVKSGLLVLGSAVLFGALLPTMGVVAAVAIVVVVSSFASHEFHWPSTLANAAILCTISYVVFVQGLGLPLPVWPELVGR